MSIRIITYPDPYTIQQNDSCWPVFANSLQFCASQTMVNGLLQEYGGKGLQVGKLIPVDTLVNKMFDDWNEIGQKINQYNEVNRTLKTICLTDSDYDRVWNSLEMNIQQYLEGIRLLYELNIKLEDINRIKSQLTLDQQYLVAAYEKLANNNAFYIKPKFSKEEVDRILLSCVESEESWSIDLDGPIVFNGIHQYSPMILRVVFTVALYHDVVLMFNYNSAYSKIYETWINVYSEFGEQVLITANDNVSFAPINDSQMIGVQLAQMLEGTISTSSRIPLSDVEMIVFDNTTEFARYVADQYELALKLKEKSDDPSHNVLAYMNEQFYSANSDVNNILRIYYPEQFGEQRFLNYPIGRFFVAIADMWNADSGNSSAGYREISECLLSGIIQNDTEGKLNETFVQCRDYLGNVDYLNLDDVISKLNTLKASLGYKLKKNPAYKKISYFNCSQADVVRLISGLSELRQIADEFFVDFSSNRESFKTFYKKITDFLKRRVEMEENLDSEFRSILSRLLERLNTTRFPDSNPTFSCLKQTMTYFLDQDEKISARWIVRNFEQIEGDILRSKHSSKNTRYHFCCVSDANMSDQFFSKYPWPLNDEFFENCGDVDSKIFRIYSVSRKERKNFKRYSLIYGLLFNKSNLVISYVKNENDKQNDQYYLLKLLGIPEIEYARQQALMESHPQISVKLDSVSKNCEYSESDRLRFFICPRKFAYDSILSTGTIYKDDFMIKKYISVLIAERVFRCLNGVVDSEMIVDQQLDKEYLSIKNDFISLGDAEWADILAYAKEILTNKEYVTDLSAGYSSEHFDCILSRSNWKNAKKYALQSDELYTLMNGTEHMKKHISGVCKTCVDREVCKVHIRGN